VRKRVGGTYHRTTKTEGNRVFKKSCRTDVYKKIGKEGGEGRPARPLKGRCIVGQNPMETAIHRVIFSWSTLKGTRHVKRSIMRTERNKGGAFTPKLKTTSRVFEQRPPKMGGE